jgi:hypothetical protein
MACEPKKPAHRSRAEKHSQLAGAGMELRRCSNARAVMKYSLFGSFHVEVASLGEL